MNSFKVHHYGLATDNLAEEFKIKFSDEEIVGMSDAGAIVESLQTKGVVG